MKPSTISDEIFASWNGPLEFSTKAENIVKNSLMSHFNGKPRFNTNFGHNLSTTSTTKNRNLKAVSRVDRLCTCVSMT